MGKIVKLNTAPTICANCEHFENRGSIWYHQFCAAVEVRLTEKIDFVTGRKGFASANDLGREVLQDHPMPYARDINNGECPYFTGRH